MKTFFSDKATYTPLLVNNLNISWTNLPINKEQSPPINAEELKMATNTKLLLNFYSLPNLFLLTFYSKNFYIFSPSMKITNIFNLITWLNFSKMYIQKTPLKDFLPLFLFPKLKTSEKKKNILYGSGLYRRPYKTLSNLWKLSRKSKPKTSYNISPMGNYFLHPQFIQYRPLFSKSQYKLQTPQIRAEVHKFEQAPRNSFFHNSNAKKIFKTKKFLSKTKQNHYRRALFLNLLLTLTKSIRIIRVGGKYKTGLKHYIKVRQGGNFKGNKKNHLFPRQYAFLNSFKKPNLRFNKSMGVKLFRRACILYKTHLKTFNLKTSKSRLRKSRSLRFKWRSRTVAKRVKFCVSKVFSSPLKTRRNYNIKLLLSNLTMTRRQKTKRLRHSKRLISKALLSSRSRTYTNQLTILLKSLLRYNRLSKLRFIKRKRAKLLKSFRIPFFKKLTFKNSQSTINNVINDTNNFKSNVKSLIISSLFKLKPLKRFRDRTVWLEKQAPYKRRVYVRKLMRRKAKNAIKLSALRRAKHRYNLWIGLINSDNTNLNLDSNGFESITKLELSKLPIKVDKKNPFNRYAFDFILNSSITYDDEDFLDELIFVELDLNFFFRVEEDDDDEFSNSWYFEDWDSWFYFKNIFYKRTIETFKKTNLLLNYNTVYNNYHISSDLIYNNWLDLEMQKEEDWELWGGSDVNVTEVFSSDLDDEDIDNYILSNNFDNNPLLINPIMGRDDLYDDRLHKLVKLYQKYQKHQVLRGLSNLTLSAFVVNELDINEWNLHESKDLFYSKNFLLNNLFYNKKGITQLYSIANLSYLPKSRHKVNLNTKDVRRGLFITSNHNIPFIFSSFGFLFVNSGQLYSTSSRFLRKPYIQSKINKYRYSFFYKNDIKKLYLRKPGRLKMVSSLLNQQDFFKNRYLQFNMFNNPSNPITGLVQVPGENTIAGSHCVSSHLTPFLNDYFSEGVGTGWPTQNRIKRIRFKPGYSRIWRKAREAINYTLRLNVRYQYRLSRRLHRLKFTSTHFAIKLTDWNLSQLVLNSRFVFDLPSSTLLIKSHLVFVNGSATDNPSLILYVGDFIQLIVSLRFYIISRWLINWNLHNKLKLNKLSRSKNNKSRRDMSKQKSNHLPDWIFTIGYRQVDIPKYLEVDYFTLSSFIIYEANTINNLNPLIHVEARPTILNMYNWKYIN